MKVYKLNKPILLSIGILSIGSMVGGYFFINKVAKNKNDVPVQTEIETGNNFNVKYAFKADSNKYGSYEFTYKVNPDVYTDQILATLTYSDDTEMDSNLLTMEHFTDERKVVVHCLNVFTKQAKVKLYAETNPDVCAYVRFDFVERLTVTLPETVTITQGETPKVDVKIETTGGSKSVNKELQNVTYNWNSNFLSWCRTQANNYLSKIVTEKKSSCDIKNNSIGENYNLTQTSCTDLFSKEFNASTFLASMGVNYSFDYHYSDDEDPDYTTEEGTWMLKDLDYSSFKTEFDGTRPIIDYSVKINGKKYEKTLGILLDKIPVQAIYASAVSFDF